MRLTKTTLSITMATVLAFGASATAAQAAWPERPITVIVAYSAGGGTDATARVMAKQLEGQLGQPVNVLNRPGAGGLTGHKAIADAKPDGYTIGLLTSSINSYKWLGQGDLTYEDYLPLALVNFDAAGFQVRADSPFKTLDEAITAIKGDPSKFSASASGIGGPWHVAWSVLMMNVGVDPKAVSFIPTKGAAPSLTELLAGGVDVVPASLPECRAMIDSGDVRALAVMDSDRHPAFPNVPTVKEAIGETVVAGVWRGFAAPKGIPADIVAKLTSAINTAYQSAEFRDTMAKRGYGLRWAEGKDFQEFMKLTYEDTGKVLVASGLARK